MQTAARAARIRRMLPKNTALPLLTVAAAAALLPASASAKPRRLAEATYTVVARATMDESWSYDENTTDLCLDGCSVEVKGSGSAHLSVKSRPTKWLVMRGFNGRPPAIDVGTGEGAAAVGVLQRSGSLTTTHSGSWAAANPPQSLPDGGCGTRNVTLPFHLTWTGRTELAPLVTSGLDDGECPDGPSSGLTWDGGGDGPSLNDVTTTTSPTRFLKTRSFTVRGTRTWTARADPVTGGANKTRSGTKTVTWSWEVTFNMDKKKRPKRHR
jgi:hypothetical protein